MKCESCFGFGKRRLFLRGYRIGIGPVGMTVIDLPGPCTTCGGSGIVHCCDGDRAQPDCTPATTERGDNP